MVSKLEDIGGLNYCLRKFISRLVEKIVVFYIGEPSHMDNIVIHRPVFYSNSAAPIIVRILTSDAKRIGKQLENLRKDKHVKSSIENTSILRRFETLVDIAEE